MNDHVNDVCEEFIEYIERYIRRRHRPGQGQNKTSHMDHGRFRRTNRRLGMRTDMAFYLRRAHSACGR